MAFKQRLQSGLDINGWVDYFHMFKGLIILSECGQNERPEATS